MLYRRILPKTSTTKIKRSLKMIPKSKLSHLRTQRLRTRRAKIPKTRVRKTKTSRSRMSLTKTLKLMKPQFQEMKIRSQLKVRTLLISRLTPLLLISLPSQIAPAFGRV